VQSKVQVKMPVSVVVGGQYGSEGKGKVALYIAQTTNAAAVVRVGGPNSGHTGVDDQGRSWIFRQLPASCLAKTALVVLPAGSLIDTEILKREVEQIGLDEGRLFIDGRATVVTQAHRRAESDEGIIESIGSTGSGTGAALRERLSRRADHKLALDDAYLKKFIHPFTPDLLRSLVSQGKRIVIEGTQGFGLSIWHGPAFPNATSRDTTAANFVAEAGMAPHDVDDVVLAIRSFPIRVGGNSGPLQNEIDWPTLASEARLPSSHVELTSATKRVRRVARFHADIVRQAITVNSPHRIVMNHLDYIDPDVKSGTVSTRAASFLADVERMIGRKIDLVGISPKNLIEARIVLSRNLLDASRS
jgi:adenylosuccinate synthase